VAHPDGEWLVGPAGGFAQANDAVAACLYERVIEWARPKGARVLELYAGSGHFTVGLARSAREVRAVEIDQSAVQAGRENLKRRGLKARWVAGASEDYANSKGFDSVVLDPPRTGARDALSSLILGASPRVVYVSCDTATLGRDLAELGRGGYRVEAASALDMFPQTAHLESVVLLVKD
jgi:23S rRNA (uracil1939-C5)-methyltransferase